MHHRPTSLLPVLLLLLFPIATTAQELPDGPGRWQLPQTRSSNGYSIALHAPPFEKWDDFAHFEALIVIEITDPTGKRADIGSIVVEGDTTVDVRRRVVHSTAPDVTRIESGALLSDAAIAAIENVTAKDPVETSGALCLARVVNANGPVLKNTDDGRFCLLHVSTSFSAEDVSGPWIPVTTLPETFDALPDDSGYTAIKATVPAKQAPTPVDILFVTESAELIRHTSTAPSNEVTRDSARRARRISTTARRARSASRRATGKSTRIGR